MAIDLQLETKGSAMVAWRTCFVKLQKNDFECLKRAVSGSSDAYYELHAALDAGDGTVSLRCHMRAAEALLVVARRDCPNAAQDIRTAIVTVAGPART